MDVVDSSDTSCDAVMFTVALPFTASMRFGLSRASKTLSVFIAGTNKPALHGLCVIPFQAIHPARDIVSLDEPVVQTFPSGGA